MCRKSVFLSWCVSSWLKSKVCGPFHISRGVLHAARQHLVLRPALCASDLLWRRTNTYTMSMEGLCTWHSTLPTSQLSLLDVLDVNNRLRRNKPAQEPNFPTFTLPSPCSPHPCTSSVVNEDLMRPSPFSTF